MKYIVINKNELYHHGIKGQKWGVRRFQNPDGTLTAEGKARYSSGKNPGDMTKTGKQGLLPELAILAMPYAVIGAGIAISAGVQSIKEHNADKRRDEAEERVKNAPRDKKNKMPLKEGESTAKEDLKNVNPGEYWTRPDTQNNCGYCTITYDLRRRGYDVIAPLTAIGTDGPKTYAKYYKDAKVQDLTTKAEYSDILKKYDNPYMLMQDRNYSKYQKSLIQVTEQTLLKQPEGSRGFIGVSWSGAYSGHSMAYEIRDGKVVVLDSQHNKEMPLKSLESKIRTVQVARLDNATPNYENIRKDWGIN